jgi:hypothetical protein
MLMGCLWQLLEGILSRSEMEIVNFDGEVFVKIMAGLFFSVMQIEHVHYQGQICVIVCANIEDSATFTVMMHTHS